MVYKTEKNRVYSEDNSGRLLAEITFPEKEKGVFCIEHTFVDDSLRGQGIASKLMELAINEIKNSGGKITASCSYAKKWLEKHSMI